MEEKKNLTPQEEAAEIRKQYARRKNECIQISIKMKQSVEILESILKMDDVDAVGENGLGRVNVHDFVWNILIWYPRQSVPFFVKRLIPLYDEARKSQHKPHLLISWMSNHVSNGKFFRHLVRVFPKCMVNDVLRIRSIDKILRELVHIEAMLDDRTDGMPVNTNMIARFVSYLHVLYPTKTSEIVGFTLELYKQCQKVNANQIVGFTALCNQSNK